MHDTMPQYLMLLPGLLCDERLWAEQREGLADSTVPRIPHLTTYASIAAMAEGVLDEAPDRFALAGFSMGGCVAMEVVAKAPKRVCRLALLSTSLWGIAPSVRQHYLDAIGGIEAGGLDTYLTNAFPLYVAPQRAHDHALWDIFASMARSLGPMVAVRQMRSLLEYPGIRCDLGQIACPTTVICGREDRRTPCVVHEELTGRIPKAGLRVIEHAGHFTPLEEPQAVTDALREWLRASI